jgi:hypothetical protein
VKRHSLKIRNWCRLASIAAAIIALSWLNCHPPATAHKTAADLVPANDEASGWTRSGSLDTTGTEAGLTTLLGSDAQPYVSNSFAGFARQYFSDSLVGRMTRIELRVADMGDSTHAASLFAALAATGQTPWTGDNPGAEARIKRDSASCAIDFRDEYFYVRVSIDTGSLPAVDAAKYFAQVVAHKADSTQRAPTRPKDAVEVIPSSNEISGWTRNGAMDIAENQTQLMDLIDGEGVTYINDGFVKCAFQDFTGTVNGGSVALALRVFDMGDSTNARTVYSDVALGSEVPWTGNQAGVEARTDESALAAYVVEFRGAKFYVKTTIEDKSTAAQDIAKLFALNIWNAIQDTTQ